MRGLALARVSVVLLASTALVQTSAAQQTDSTGTRMHHGMRHRGQQDSTQMGQDTTHHRGRRRAAGGEVALGSRTSVYRGDYGLQSDQVRQLQTALKNAGCDPGAIDGVMGPHTRRAMMCERSKEGVTTSNVNDLLRAMNLGFTATDSVTRSRGMGRMRGTASDTGAMRTPPDSAQRGTGMHNARGMRRGMRGNRMRDTTRSRNDTSSRG